MKEVDLSVLERILMVGMFNHKESKVDIETLRSILDDVKEVGMSEEEKKELNLRDAFVNKETGLEVTKEEAEALAKDGKETTQQVKWDKSIDKKIKLQPKTVEFILNFIKDKSDKKELTVVDAPLLTIESKLK